jgi:hypothetical protein
MFVFVQRFKSNKAPTFTVLLLTEVEAREHAKTLAESSVDVLAVDMYKHMSTLEKQEVFQWS